jgi:hypothetical protein
MFGNPLTKRVFVFVYLTFELRYLPLHCLRFPCWSQTPWHCLFPNVKPGLTTRLACLWRGPFKVIAKITDVTYKINCGRKGKPQVLHVDRIRKKYPQNLQGEESEQINQAGFRFCLSDF